MPRVQSDTAVFRALTDSLLLHSAFQSLHKTALVGSVDSNYAGKGMVGSNHSSCLNWRCTKPHDDMTQKEMSLGTLIDNGDLILWRRVSFQVIGKVSPFGDVIQMYVDRNSPILL